MLDPPSSAGALKETTADVSRAVADTSRGLLGAVRGTTAGDEDEEVLEPTALIAFTVKV
jgi:hypothetical protein